MLPDNRDTVITITGVTITGAVVPAGMAREGYFIPIRQPARIFRRPPNYDVSDTFWKACMAPRDDGTRALTPDDSDLDYAMHRRSRYVALVATLAILGISVLAWW